MPTDARKRLFALTTVVPTPASAFTSSSEAGLETRPYAMMILHNSSYDERGNLDTGRDRAVLTAWQAAEDFGAVPFQEVAVWAGLLQTGRGERCAVER